MAKEQSKSQAESPETGGPMDDSQKGQVADMLNLSGGGGESKPKENLENFLQGGNPGHEKLPKGAVEEGEEEGEETLEEEEESDGLEDLLGEEDEEEEDSEDSEEEEEEEEEEEPLDPNASVLKEMADLRAELAELKKGKEGKVEEEPAPKVSYEIDPDELVTEEEAMELLTDPLGALKKILPRVYARAREDTIKDIPDLVASAQRRQMGIQEARVEFAKEFPDIVEMQKKNEAVASFLRVTINNVQGKHPDWNAQQILKEAGLQVRGALGNAKKASDLEKGGKTRKSNQLKKPRGQRQGGQEDERSGTQKQLDEMMNLGR